jgi:hypothetical protein
MKALILFPSLWILIAGTAGCSVNPLTLIPKARTPVIVAGTVLKIALIDPIGTDKSMPGDHFSATLAEPVVVDGKTVLEAGTRVRGRVFDLREPRRVNGGAAVRLILTEIVYGGMPIAITTQHFEAIADTSAAVTGGDIHFATKARLDFILASRIEL